VKGIQGGVFVEFTLMPDGRSRNPRIIYSVPTNTFEPTVRDGLLHSEFAVKSESKAISMAERLKWDVAPLNDRLARYTANQPWYGTLLDF